VLKNFRAFVGSYSFRAGLLIFLTLSALLITLRVQFYRESIETAYSNVRAIIEAHEEDINQAIQESKGNNGLDIVDSIMGNLHDRRLYLELREGGRKTGNLPTFDFDQQARVGWSQITIPTDQGAAPHEALIKLSRYSEDISLLVGYDLANIQALRATLFSVLVSNVLLAFAVALVLSAISVWFINVKLRQVNKTAESVIRGNISERVPVRQMSDQFDRLGENINRMLDWIGKLLETAKYASNALAHDMRTPLSRHRIELRALSERADVPEDIREEIMQAVERVDNLAIMFSNITNIARAEAREGAELFKTFDLTAVVRDVVDLYTYEFEKNDQLLVVEIPDGVVNIFGDRQLISQAIANLVDNASKYAPAKSTVKVAVEPDRASAGDRVLVIVSDNGPGIPAELHEKVVQRFFRLEQSRHTEGTGLGLSLVNAVAGLHQGSLYFQDNNPGLKVILAFPALNVTWL
jgi:signal transduction histidine kinase